MRRLSARVDKRATSAAAALAVFASLVFSATSAHAAGRISLDDTRWISLGAGVRASFFATQNAAPSGADYSKDFLVNNARLYVNGQIHEYLKFEFNTECVFCGNAARGEFILLDAIAKVDLSPHFNVWLGRLVVPSERQELNGPYFSTTFDPYKTPFFPADFSVDFGAGGAGVYIRDHGVNIWGALGPGGALQYVAGVFQGLQSGPGPNAGPNTGDNPLFAGRIAYNFLNVEKNPGYYTSGTYYGGLGNILTLGAVAQYQANGSGSSANPGDFLGLAADLLFEGILDGAGVVTLTGEYKFFNADYPAAAFDDDDAFLMFDGHAFFAVALYMFEPKVWIGRFQPYVRYTGVYPSASSNREEYEAGLNYVVDGHNARASVFYQFGDIATKGMNYAPNADGEGVNAIKLAIQLQI